MPEKNNRKGMIMTARRIIKTVLAPAIWYINQIWRNEPLDLGVGHGIACQCEDCAIAEAAQMQW